MSSIIAPSFGARRQAMLEAGIRRYAKPYRRRLRKMAKTAGRLGDLILTFPAAAFAMVSNRGPVEGRGQAVRLVKEGAPLEWVAQALGLPFWTRRLAPEAFETPFGVLETDAEFDRRISGFAPQAADGAAMWLDWLLTARRYGGDDFALWLARQEIYGGERLSAEAVIPLAAYAWHSGRPTAPARAQMVKFWTARMGFRSAANEARNWLLRVLNERCRKPVEARGGWWTTQSANGFKFAPRDTRALLETEGRIMNNCVAGYWDKVRGGECLIYAIRRGGSPVATMEIQPNRGDRTCAVVAQLLGPGNATAPEQVWRAARIWLKRQGPYPLRGGGGALGGIVDPERWAGTWAPYCADRPVAEVFGPAPDRNRLMVLERGYAALGRVAKR